MTDFDHIEDEIDSIEDKIEIEYDGRGYEELTDKEKEKTILDHFFHGKTKYSTSAQKLRIGLDEYKGGNVENNSKIVKITYKNGKSHYQVRNKDGTFGRWIRE